MKKKILFPFHKKKDKNNRTIFLKETKKKKINIKIL